MKAVEKDLSWLVDDLVEDIHTIVSRHWADLSRRDRLRLVAGIVRHVAADHLEARKVVGQARRLLSRTTSLSSSGLAWWR